MTIPESKVALMIMEKDHRALTTVFKNVAKLIKQQVKDNTIGMGVSRNHFIYPLLEKTMTRAIEGGIPQYFLEFMLKFYMKVIEDDPKEPKVFGINDLHFGFVVWICSFAISLTAFSIELLWTFVKKKFWEFHVIFHIQRFLGRGFL